MSYRTILWLAQQASRSKKTKRFFDMLKDPKKKARFLEKTKESKAYNRLKALKQKTGQEIMDFQKTGKIQKKLAGGLLRQGIKIIYRDPASRKALHALKDFILKGYKAKNLQSLGPVGKLELKLRKAQGLKKYSKLISTKLNPDRFQGSLPMTRKAKRIMKTAELTAGKYEKKIKQITKAFMHKRANPQIKTHSEGGEIIIGKNVDRDLL